MAEEIKSGTQSSAQKKQLPLWKGVSDMTDKEQTMLYRTLKRMIERGQTEGIEKRLDVFYAAGKLTDDEYSELIGMLK